MTNTMKDYIVSGSRNERYASIEYAHSQELEYYCYGKVLEQRLPERLGWLLHEYDQLVQHVVLTLLEDVEDEILTYELQLESTGQRIFNVMLIGEDISFFTQPTVNEEDIELELDEGLADGNSDSRGIS